MCRMIDTLWGPEAPLLNKLKDSMKMFDPALPVTTRDGRPARILAADRKPLTTADPGLTIVALIRSPHGGELVKKFYPDGRASSLRDNSPNDLVNVLPETTEYVNLADAYSSFRAARDATLSNWPILKVIRRGDVLVSAEVVNG